MDEPDWFCNVCGVPYECEALALGCAWLDEIYGIGEGPSVLAGRVA